MLETVRGSNNFGYFGCGEFTACDGFILEQLPSSLEITKLERKLRREIDPFIMSGFDSLEIPGIVCVMLPELLSQSQNFQI